VEDLASGVTARPSVAVPEPDIERRLPSIFTGVFGFVFLGSLIAERPLMYYLARQFATGGDPVRILLWNDRWRHPGFRHAMGVMTAIWSAAFVADALIRVGLIFVLSTRRCWSSRR
jgi:hypothetical protein